MVSLSYISGFDKSRFGKIQKMVFGNKYEDTDYESLMSEIHQCNEVREMSSEYYLDEGKHMKIMRKIFVLFARHTYYVEIKTDEIPSFIKKERISNGTGNTSDCFSNINLK